MEDTMGIEIPLTWNDSFMTGVDRIDQQQIGRAHV
jgi:hypothetical protein